MMSPARSTWLPIVIALVAACRMASTAQAQPRADEVALAQQHFERGITLYDREDYAAALESFRASSGLVPSPNSSLYIARCYRGLERYAESAEAFEATLVEIRTGSDTTGRYASTANAAQEELGTVEQHIGRLVLSGNLSDEAEISIGARTIPVRALGLPVAVTPGTVTVAIVDGGSSWTQSVDVAAREEASLRLDAAAASPSDETDRHPTEADLVVSNGAGPPMWTIVGTISSAVVAVLGWGLAAGFGAAASSRFSELDTACMGGPCPPELQPDVDQGRSFQTAANVGIAIGLVGTLALATFLTLVLTLEEDSPVVLDAAAGRLRFVGL